MKNLVERFNSVNSLKVNLEREIEDTEVTIQEYSNLLGEKIRMHDESSADDPDFLALKAKLDGSSDAKTSDKKIDDKKTTDEETTDEETTDEETTDEETTDEETTDEETTDEETNKTKKIKDKAEAKKKSDKKKKSKKGGLSDKWYDLTEIHIYNGMGIKGELELYFKAVDELKSRLENLQRCLATLNTVIEKGLKEDLGCIAFRGSEGIVEISFIKSTGVRQNFSLKSIYTGRAIPVANKIKIGV